MYARRNVLCAALAGAALSVTSGLASGVNLSGDGRGQVLLYPYYTVRSDAGGNVYSTLLSVVNGTGSAKAVRVRFLEGKDARPVLDLNLFLSPYDVWTAAVLPDPNSDGARVGSVDLSCTLPLLIPFPPAGTYLSFSNNSYSGANDDGAGTGLDRTKEGYFEVIEMASFASNSTTGIAVTHVNGTPPCHQFLPSAGNQLSDAQAALDAKPPSGGLFGALTLINVNAGTDYTADATALANFSQSGSNYQRATGALPDLTQATPPTSAVQGPDGRLYESTWSAGTADAVSAVLMHDTFMNEFVLDSATKSGTDWVVTMPTKRYYVATGTGNAPKLFQRNFDGSSGACDDLNVGHNECPDDSHLIFDREERTSSTPLCFLPSGAPWPILGCWVANTYTFNNSNVIGSAVTASAVTGYQNGWANFGPAINIPGASPTVHTLVNSGATSISGGGKPTMTGATVTYIGLPMIGFSVVSFTNGTLQVGSPPTTMLSNYGGNFAHKFSTTIQ